MNQYGLRSVVTVPTIVGALFRVFTLNLGYYDHSYENDIKFSYAKLPKVFSHGIYSTCMHMDVS